MDQISKKNKTMSVDSTFVCFCNYICSLCAALLKISCNLVYLCIYLHSLGELQYLLLCKTYCILISSLHLQLKDSHYMCFCRDSHEKITYGNIKSESHNVVKKNGEID